MKGKVDVILGLVFGDEGKGKIIDLISHDYDIVARFNGSDNAGHSIVIDNKKHVLHLIPSGVFRPNCINIIGNGCLINPISFVDEINKLKEIGIDITQTLYISKRAHLILPTHRLLDKSSEISKGSKKIGSTLKGIGPTYMDKTGRNGIRVGDIFGDVKSKLIELSQKHLSLLHKDMVIDAEDYINEQNKWIDAIEILKQYNIIDSEIYINQALSEGKSVLAEGAQGTLLDVDFGSYPFVTSSNTTIAGVVSGLGIAPNKINGVTGIFKAYTTRVGSGPFPTELDNEIGEKMRKIGNEYGSTTGRERRCGWLDIPLLKYSCMINGVTELNIMKIDVLSEFDKINVCTGYLVDGKFTQNVPYDISDVIPVYKTFDGWNRDISKITDFYVLPNKCQEYIKFLEKEVGIPITRISVGPDRKQTINR
jgi:adenylosuccinate synthase